MHPLWLGTTGTSIYHVQLNDKVTTEYRGIVAQSFQLVHTGDYVELDVPCEVCAKVHM